MTGFLADCRHALRLYQRTRGASFMAVAVLAVGMAFVVAFVSLYVDLVLRPQPGFEQSSSFATVGQSSNGSFFGLPGPVVERMADEMASVEAVVWDVGIPILVGPDREEASMEMVSAQFFDGLRPRLALGRGLLPEDHETDSEPVAVISYGLWQERFGGDPGILGTEIDLSHKPGEAFIRRMESTDPLLQGFLTLGEPDVETTRFRIVGVMSSSLHGLTRPDTAVWVAVESAFTIYVGDTSFLTRPPTFVRKAPGVSAAAVQNELETRFSSELGANAPIAGTRYDVIDGIVLDPAVQRDTTRQLEIFLGGSILLALVAAANVSLFLLARAPTRRRELGIRQAVGAHLRRIMRQLATEAGLLMAAAAALGLALSVWLANWLRGLAFLRDAEWSDVSLLDWRVLGLTAAFLLVLTVLVALAPIVGLNRLSIGASSRQTSARASLAQRLAGTAQVAGAGALGAAAIAFAWYLGTMLLGDPGYAVADRYTAEFWMRGRDTSVSGPRRESEIPSHEILEAIPGITAVAFGNLVPGQESAGRYPTQILHPVDAATTVPDYSVQIDHRFIDVVGLRLVHGRGPEYGEGGALVNQTLARALWGRENVVGEQLSYAARNYSVEVIGVLEDVSFGHPAAAIRPYFFLNVFGSPGGTVVFDTRLTLAALQQEITRRIESGEIEFDMSDFRALEIVRNELLAPDRARAFLTIATATLVVLLAAFGYYGTQRYLVAAGRREYAIRASLGAGPTALGRLVVLRGLAMSIPGLVLGGLLAFIVVSWLRDDFLGRNVSPALVTIAVVAGLSLLLIVASLGPARQARRTQPAPLLRED